MTAMQPSDIEKNILQRLMRIADVTGYAIQPEMFVVKANPSMLLISALPNGSPIYNGDGALAETALNISHNLFRDLHGKVSDVFLGGSYIGSNVALVDPSKRAHSMQALENALNDLTLSDLRRSSGVSRQGQGASPTVMRYP